ncbi:2-amino-3,7-dideoxy-D-threo-hept-6-ulosonate synthase [Halobaculum litoreum]|uniref:2-amino-3,7-dideoxy-D-threo-hept-6-ulosonate synthase n=1 Tax=Halobaculum litoreum TaxID=3031998 RepID=A0ABD5XS84_9EURY|nr:2-amino-3,7-dideoxy-D-threo-hept-6-ulosonate synthase [Halobaculum sp. DT92]
MELAGLAARMDRISTDDRILMVPMDHGITLGAVKGLKDIEGTIDAVTRGGADAVLTQPGIAPRVHDNKHDAGYVVHLNASTVVGPESNDKRRTGSVKSAIRAGADAVSMHINVGSDYEPEQMTFLSELCEEANEYGVPVLAMAYARGANLEGDDPEHDAEYLGHAVRLAEECGADLVKTAYSGDAESFQHVCESTRLPVIIAGGSPVSDLATLENVRGAMDAGAAGVSMGRTIFQHDDPEAMTRAVSAVVHDDADAEDALSASGL